MGKDGYFAGRPESPAESASTDACIQVKPRAKVLQIFTPYSFKLTMSNFRPTSLTGPPGL
jgi:hypothetical protein